MKKIQKNTKKNIKTKQNPYAQKNDNLPNIVKYSSYYYIQSMLNMDMSQLTNIMSKKLKKKKKI